VRRPVHRAVPTHFSHLPLPPPSVFLPPPSPRAATSLRAVGARVRRKIVGKTAPTRDPRSSPSGTLGLSRLIVNRSNGRGAAEPLARLPRRSDPPRELHPCWKIRCAPRESARETILIKARRRRGIREKRRVSDNRGYPARARIPRINYLILQMAGEGRAGQALSRHRRRIC